MARGNICIGAGAFFSQVPGPLVARVTQLTLSNCTCEQCRNYPTALIFHSHAFILYWMHVHDKVTVAGQKHHDTVINNYPYTDTSILSVTIIHILTHPLST